MKKLKKYWKKLFRKFCFSIIALCTYLVAIKVDLFLALFFPLLLGMLIRVNERVGFRHALDDEQYAFSYSGSRVKQRTPLDLVTRGIDKIFGKNLGFHVKYCSRGKVQYLAFSNFLLVLAIFSFWEEDWALYYNSMEFWGFLRSYVVWQLVSQFVFTISVNHVPFHLLWKKHLVKYLQVPKFYNHGCKFQRHGVKVRPGPRDIGTLGPGTLLKV